MQRLARLLLVALVALVMPACAGSKPPADPLVAMRDAAAQSSDGEVLGRWLLGELYAPGGTAARASAARKRLDAAAPEARGMFASLARALDDEAHGRFQSAARWSLDALAAARSSQHPDAPLVGWFTANHLLNLRTGVANLWPSAENVVLHALDHPGNIGWRARSELVEWWSADGFRDASGGDATRGGMLEASARRYGCVAKARMAGPFGHMAASDHREHYPAEAPGPWPAVFPQDPRRIEPPRTLAVERLGCSIRAQNPSGNGIFYVETFVDIPESRDVIVAVQGAFAVFVDDVEVLTRDTRRWGIWPRFGAHVRLAGGRHRILARIGGPETSLRLLRDQGTPLDGDTSDDPGPAYAIEPPEVLPDVNVLTPFLTDLGVPPQPGVPRPRAARDTTDPISRMLASYLAHLEGQDDVADVLVEPLVKDPARATGPALALEAAFAEKDPIFPQSDARDLAKDARARAAAKDPELWWPRFWLALDEAEKSGLPEVAPKLQALADHFREVPDILKGLAAIYGKVGWKVERTKAVEEAARRFPDDVEALSALLSVYDEEGRVADADKLAARIKQLDVDSEVDFQRAMDRRDYAAAAKELQRLGRARKDRRDIAARLADVATRAGRSKESLAKLEAAVKKSPEDGAARLALADARLARGDRKALSNALVEAIQKGADTADLRDAIELVDGIDELSAYRLDGRRVIADFERAKVEMPGTAARVLDYSAIWVHTDGSARMLEHEIIRIQSREGIQEHAEQRLPRGLVLNMRTIKKDGTILDPEFVEGKQTVTMPHLEVGDYIETESITQLRGDGAGGKIFEGPRWFFREEKIPYFRSEFVVISPKTRPLDVETTGAGVPKPTITESGALVTRRWRVDKSPALPEEPAMAPIQEFLPSVRIGWGMHLADTIARL
ncbi:MAG TPA: DUF3857 domain-containing protein, partial [Minicystis sp.]|nr:DUF3857 domain-containing protein [Minicystis sp.]